MKNLAKHKKFKMNSNYTKQKGELVNPNSNVLRAVGKANYCDKNNRPSSALFKNNNISVNDLDIENYESSIEIFKRLVHKPDNPLCGTCEIKVSELSNIGESCGRKISVYHSPDITSKNPAHCDINPSEKGCPKITPSIAKKIIKKAIYKSVDLTE